MGMLTGISIPRSAGGGGGAPSGPAGGDLTGTYPNPDLQGSAVEHLDEFTPAPDGVTDGLKGLVPAPPAATFTIDAVLAASGVWVTYVSSLPVAASYVDNVNGDDATAAASRLDLPFKTIQAAITATSAPNWIVVYSGNYNEQITLKNNVYIWMNRGVVLDWTGASGDTVSYPGTSGQNYVILGYGQIKNSSTNGGASAVSGSVQGAGHMTLECVSLIGQGTAGNRALNLTAHNIDPNTNASIPSRIEIKYVESNNLVANYAVDINWGGGPAKLKIGTINNISAQAGSRCLRIQSQSGLGSDILDFEIERVIDTVATGGTGQASIEIDNAGGGSTAFLGNIYFIFSGNKQAISTGPDVEIRSRLIQNNSSSQPTVGGSGGSKIVGSLIQNLSSNGTAEPIINSDTVDTAILFENCRFANPNGTPSNSPIQLKQYGANLVRFKNCGFLLASTDTKGLLDVESASQVAFWGDNVIIRRAGTSPSIGSSLTPALRIFGEVYSNVDKDAAVTVASGNFVFDNTITLATSMGNYFA